MGAVILLRVLTGLDALEYARDSLQSAADAVRNASLRGHITAILGAHDIKFGVAIATWEETASAFYALQLSDGQLM